VPETASGQRLDQWLVSQLPDASRVRIQQLITQSQVLVNGSPAKSSLRLRGQERIAVTDVVARQPLKALPEDIPLDIVYEDDSIVVLNKPAGMVVHAGSGKNEAGNKGTLVNALLHRFGRLSGAGGELRPGIVHRLDKETSGLLIVAKTDQAHRKLAQQFSRRETRKTYIALVHGWMPQADGTIATAISRDLLRRTRMTTRRSRGREAITHWKTIKQFESLYGKFSLLEVRIETGRTHQIRVHLSSIGHPVVGDTLYGAPQELRFSVVSTGARRRLKQSKSDESTGNSISLGRNFLHAAAIQFKHPVTDTPTSFKQPLPDDLDLFLTVLGGR
jgi:23S rRNA pseudouridine1911/1915/1917 synthase